MFIGLSNTSLDNKGRLVVPSRYRDSLRVQAENAVVLTLNPSERCLWLYPLPEWETISKKLATLSDFDSASSSTKRMMMGYATDCQLDGQSRILIPKELRTYADLRHSCVITGQGNKFEIWDADNWKQQHDEWLELVNEGDTEISESLKMLSL